MRQERPRPLLSWLPAVLDASTGLCNKNNETNPVTFCDNTIIVNSFIVNKSG